MLALSTHGLLLVEDDRNFVGLVRALLEGGRVLWRVETVDRIEEALRRVGQPGVEVMLLDLALKDGAGIEGLRRLRDADPDLPIVVLSSGDERMAADALRLGAEDYLLKWELSGPLLALALTYAMYRKSTERRLLESDARLRAAVQESPDAVIIADVCHDESGRVTGLRVAEMNGAAEALCGLARSAVVGHSLEALGDLARDPDLVASCARLAEDGRRFELECLVPFASSQRALLYEGAPLQGGLVLWVKDVTGAPGAAEGPPAPAQKPRTVAR